MGRKTIKAKHRYRTVGGDTQGGGEKPFWESWDNATMGEFFFTPALNAALEWAMKNTGLPDVNRLDFYLMRHSWGNWYPYAIQNIVDGIGAGDADLRWMKELLFGKGPCPLCGKVAHDPHMPRGCRWHRPCVAVAYARDTMRLDASPEQRKWAAETLAEAEYR